MRRTLRCRAGIIQVPPRGVSFDGRTYSRPTSPQSRHRTRNARRSEPLPWLIHSPSGSTRHASQAVGRELVVMGVQAGEGAEVDHGARVLLGEAQVMS